MDGLIAYALSKKYTDGKTSGITTGMSWKGTKENISNLPQSGNSVGDLWHVNEDGNEYAWDGSKWEALGGIHSGGSAPFEIPVTRSGSTWTTTASAADILANKDNCVLVESSGSVMYPAFYVVQGSNAQIVFSGTDSVNGFIQNVTFTIAVTNDTVTIGYYEARADELPTVTASDNGKSLVVDNGVWSKGYQAVRIPRVAMTAFDTTPTLDPNKLYVFPEMASLAPTLATPTDNTIVNEYHFIFTSGATATVLTLPATILQPDGFTVEANMHYEISILEGAMTAQGWAVTA